jgi:hypothetical protein
VKRVPMIGHRFGRLVVIAEAPRQIRPNGARVLAWECRCDCGAKVASIAGANLRSGSIVSCGCYRRELSSRKSTTHGNARTNRTTPEYRSWINMRTRCYNPNDRCFHNYGGRGITVCDRWHPKAGGSFENFLQDVGKRPTPNHSIDRINPDGNYEPGNVRWATVAEQARNRSKASHHWVTFQGNVMILSDAARAAGISCDTLSHRIRSGWPEERWFVPLMRVRGREASRKAEQT